MATLAKKLPVQAICLTVYIVLGALMFSIVEKKAGAQEMTLSSLKATMKSKYNMSAPDFHEFVLAAQTATKQWTWPRALGFTLSVVTTIGYGVVTPTTPLGQLLVILYALPGIPLALITINSIGSLISSGIARLVHAFEKRALKRAEPLQLEVKVSGLTCLLTVATIFAGSALSVQMTGWTYLEAFYFWTVTLTTIGFGDYILGDTFGEMAKETESLRMMGFFLSFLGILFGLAAVASMLNSFIVLAGKGRCPLMLCPCSSRIGDSHEREDDDQSSTTTERHANGKTAMADVTLMSMHSLRK